MPQLLRLYIGLAKKFFRVFHSLQKSPNELFGQPVQEDYTYLDSSYMFKLTSKTAWHIRSASVGDYFVLFLKKIEKIISNALPILSVF